MTAVIYARYSSDNQREESIEGQMRECTEYASRNNITIVGSYVDRAQSARTAGRPEFQRMIADSEKHIFDAVIVWKLDRFSRDRYDSAYYKQALKKNGVKVISAKENISEGPEGIILESILEGFAEYYSAELSQKIQRGHHDNALKAKNNGGYTPVGYMIDQVTHALVIDPIMAPLVREIYERYDKGESITDIGESLKQRGIKTKRGTDFSKATLGRVLSSRKYIGEYKYADVVIPEGIPAIIEKDQFERVQNRMKANKKAPARAKAQEEYLLTTKLFCGDCGRIMAGESGKNGQGVIYHYYKCGGAKRKLGCKRKAVKKDWIEEAVVRITVSKVLTDQAIDRIADAILGIQNDGDTLTPALMQELKECEKGIENLMNAIQMGILTASTKERLVALEEQREALKLSLLRAQLERPKYSKEYIISWINRFKYGNIHDKAYRKEIIDIFVNSVYLYDDHVVFTYNFKDGNHTLTLQEIEAALSSDFANSGSPEKHLCQLTKVFFSTKSVLRPE